MSLTPRMGCTWRHSISGASLPPFQVHATEHRCTGGMGQHGAEVTNHQSYGWHLRHAYGPPDPCMRIGSGIFTRRVHSYDITLFLCRNTRCFQPLVMHHWETTECLMGKTLVPTILVCNIRFATAPSSRVRETQFLSLANPAHQREKTAIISPIIELNSPIVDLGPRPAALSHKYLNSEQQEEPCVMQVKTLLKPTMFQHVLTYFQSRKTQFNPPTKLYTVQM